MLHARSEKLAAAGIVPLALAGGAAGAAGERQKLPATITFENASGVAATYSTKGAIDLANPFFQSLGSNGRACVSCHAPQDGWSVTPQGVRARFDKTAGIDPIFRTNDGSVPPNADVSTLEARLVAYDMLLTKGLIRVGIGIPAGAQFELVAVDDPYGYASAKELSLFRRPLPSTNLAFLSTVMFDGRETFLDPASRDCLLGTSTCFAPIHFDLGGQANGATTGHAQGANGLTAAQRDAIVDFETSLFTAQVFDDEAGNLTARHAGGGPWKLSATPFHFGVNDSISGDYLTGALFDPAVFRLYESWNEVGHQPPDPGERIDRSAARTAVARGEALFDSKPIMISGVHGLNDDLRTAVIQGTCSTCHDTPNAGSHSVPAPLDIRISDASRRTPDMPLYTLRHLQALFETVQTTDPGRALITGQWKDIGRFKGPTLRGLAARPPYFHGSAPDIPAVVQFYDQRFGIGFTADEKRDLIAFLLTL